MNTDSTSSEDEYNPSNRQGNLRTARKSTTGSQSQSRSSSSSSRRQAAKRASKAISASASSTSTSTSSFEKTMETFNPDLSQREKRKIIKKFQPPVVTTTRKPLGAVYDEYGTHMSTNINMCDCLDIKCAGCFFECPKCGSEKCGKECRVHRNYIIDCMEYHGREKIVKNPLLRK
ncbi:unnamed protein product [Ceutorhynchus assimilis]|uniref:ARF7 effector protein C-terminal domain-containing protein n=1 Tax=Ceutorhynchus assimilis TaxID=467358 RepID=A0A9N9MBK4_9CUCU|nr:unnamed protein product [Ceutorhynchus assimilis]